MLLWQASAEGPTPFADAYIYTRSAADQLASPEARQEGRLRLAQGPAAAANDDNIESRSALKKELDRIRATAEGNAVPAFEPPIPVRKKAASPNTAGEAATSQRTKQVARKIDPEIDRVLGRLLLVRFRGTQSSEAGPKAVHALLQSGLVTGALFTLENIQSKAQLKDLMKYLGPPAEGARPIFAIEELGGGMENLPASKDFEQFPSERDVAAKGEPEYAYSTYRSMAASLATLGFNMNFGPAIGLAGSVGKKSESFSDNPLQTGVFAKTFILGHREAGIMPVPIVDGSDLSVRALKTLLISYPTTPIAAIMTDEIEPFAPYEGLVRGPRFCFVSAAAGSEAEDAAGNFNRGCDVLILDGGTEGPTAVRESLAQGVAEAIQHGELTLEALKASAQRLFALRASFASQGQGVAARTAHSP